MQGVYTLELQASMKVMLHFMGAMIFMWGGMQHAQTVEPVYSALYADSAALAACPMLSHAAVVASSSYRKYAITGGMPIVGFVLPLVFQLFSFVYGEPTKNKSDENPTPLTTGPKTDKEKKKAKEEKEQAAAGTANFC